MFFLRHCKAGDFAISKLSVSSAIRSEGKGIAMIHVTKGCMEKRKFPLPPLSVQQEIVTRIKEKQKLVEANKKLIGIYEQKIKDKIAEVWGKETISKT